MKKLILLVSILVWSIPSVLVARDDRGNTSGSVVFTSIPPNYGEVGVVYTYDAHAVAQDSGVVHYFLAPMAAAVGVPRVSLDSVTGVMTWKPNMRGWYGFGIMAVSDRGGRGFQQFQVMVTGGYGIIQGKVTDTLNLSVAGIVVEAYKVALDSFIVGPANQQFDGGAFSYSAVTDQHGNYRIAGVDPGPYKLREFSPLGLYLSQWYDGKPGPETANIVMVSDTPAVLIADFSVRKSISYSVSGTVTDSVGAPVKSATVFLVDAGFALNGNSATVDFRQFLDGAPGDLRLDGPSPYVRRASVDSTGSYVISVPMSGAYIAFAKAPGYFTQFYQGQSNPLSATIIQVQGSIVGINFTLTSFLNLPPSALGSISGMVEDTSLHVGVRARVIAQRDPWHGPDTDPRSRSYVTDTDSTGDYSFSTLIPGSYVVLALPLGNYGPAFYSSDTVNYRWKRATPVTVDGNSVSNINIFVRPLCTAMRGFTSVGGRVQASSLSVSGAIVYAMRDNQTAGFAISGNGGAYAIAGLAPGTYSVILDKPGYEDAGDKNSTVGYTPGGSPVPGNADFNVSSVAAVEQTSPTVPAAYSLSQNYPNPFNPSTTIRYALASRGVVSLKVFNILGQEVATLVSAVQEAGSYQATFNASRLTSGIYFYRLKAGNFSDVKRMVLLK